MHGGSSLATSSGILIASLGSALGVQRNQRFGKGLKVCMIIMKRLKCTLIFNDARNMYMRVYCTKSFNGAKTVWIFWKETSNIRVWESHKFVMKRSNIPKSPKSIFHIWIFSYTLLMYFFMCSELRPFDSQTTMISQPLACHCCP